MELCRPSRIRIGTKSAASRGPEAKYTLAAACSAVDWCEPRVLVPWYIPLMDLHACSGSRRYGAAGVLCTLLWCFSQRDVTWPFLI
ncbi:hypothetical protein BDW69DRAFT_178968, partial [Aspergillus filifer]